MAEEVFDLMGYIDEQSGGGEPRYITEITLRGGWFVFAKGSPTERFWPFNGRDEAEVRFEEANAYIDTGNIVNSKGERARPFAAMELILYADSVLNREVSWNKGVWMHHLPGFTMAYRDALKPTIDPLLPPSGDYVYGTKIWAHINFVPDPDPKQRKRSDGRENLIPVVEQVFANREEALAAVATIGSVSPLALVTAPEQPEGYSADIFGDWSIFFKDLVNGFVDDPNAPDESFVQESIGVTQEVISSAREEAQKIADTKTETDSIPF